MDCNAMDRECHLLVVSMAFEGVFVSHVELRVQRYLLESHSTLMASKRTTTGIRIHTYRTNPVVEQLVLLMSIRLHIHLQF